MSDDHSSTTNFAGIEQPYCEQDNSKFTVIPVPYDLTTTYIPGTKKGPQAILEASTHMELYDEELLKETYRAGIHTRQPVPVQSMQPEEMLRMVAEVVSSDMRSGRIQVVLGGEHSISLAPVQELIKLYPNMSVLQLDAHADLRDSYEGTPYNHACVGRRISERCPLVQAGVRSMSKEEADFKQSSQVLTFSDYDFKNSAGVLRYYIEGIDR